MQEWSNGRLVLGAVLIATLSGMVGALGAVLLGGVWAQSSPNKAAESKTPGMDLIDAFSCPSGLVKEVHLRGIEDGFAREGDEPAIPRAALRELPMVQQMEADEIPNAVGLRDYDEPGDDKFLLDHFEVEPGIVSGKIIFSAKPLGGGQNDSVHIGTRIAEKLGEEFFKDIIFITPGGGPEGTPFDGFYAGDENGLK